MWNVEEEEEGSERSSHGNWGKKRIVAIICAHWNISTCKNIISKTSSERNQNPLRYYKFNINFKFPHKPTNTIDKKPW